MANALLAISGALSPKLQEEQSWERRPAPDYLAMLRALCAELPVYPGAFVATGFFGEPIEKFAGRNALLAWAYFIRAHGFRVIFTESEDVGATLVPVFEFLGFLLPIRPRRLVLVHILSVSKKMLFLGKLGIRCQIDTFLVHSMWQKHFIEDRGKERLERMVITPFMVDAAFFRPDAITSVAPDRLI